MILVSPRFHVAAVLCLVAATAAPLGAATSKRHLITPLPQVTVTGTVTDAVTNKPVKGVQIANGVVFSLTDDAGLYSIKLPAGRPTLLTATYFAYKPLTRTVTPSDGATFDFALASNPSIFVKTKAGETVDLDYDSSKFAYIVVFSGYVMDDSANLCKPDGSAWGPNKSEFNKIVGPATDVNFSPCCTRGPVTTVNVEMKTGEKTAVYFNDSCFGNEEDFLGRERSTGNFRYFSFKDITEIDFP
jgi:Carboxypeptidase regulatory-like domain